MASLARKFFLLLGYDWRFSRRRPPGSHKRPVGDMALFLEDLGARGVTPKSVVDVGANRGDWSRWAKKVFPEADFFLIEPMEEMKKHLEAFCAEFPGSRYFLAGAGAKPGTLTFTQWEDTVSSSFLPAPSEEKVGKGIQRAVPILTLDSLIKEKGVPTPEIVKLDVQGFELEALKGGESLFGSTEVFVLEVSLYPFLPGNPVLHEVVEFMWSRGYLAYDLPGFHRRPLDGALGQVDIAFARKDGPLMCRKEWQEGWGK